MNTARKEVISAADIAKMKYKKLMGDVSANGFVYEVALGNTPYVLKSTRKSSADNLLYEYFAGQYINARIKELNLSCFIWTYALFKYKSEDGWNRSITAPESMPSLKLRDFLALQNKSTFKFGEACTEPTHLAIILEMISGQSLGAVCGRVNLRRHETVTSANVSQLLHFTEKDLLYVLLQIYIPLMMLRHEFTHYDLHKGNVLLVRNKSPVSFTFTVPQGSVTFSSNYTSKIIDYGRCFFQHPDAKKVKLGAPYVYSQVCRIENCNNSESGSCGNRVGFGWLASPASTLSTTFRANNNYFINSSRANISHDLRLLYSLTSKLTYLKDYITRYALEAKFPVTLALADMTSHVVYDGTYGTKPLQSATPGVAPAAGAPILNVSDAALRLIDIHNANNSVPL